MVSASLTHKLARSRQERKPTKMPIVVDEEKDSEGKKPESLSFYVSNSISNSSSADDGPGSGSRATL